MPDLFGTPTPTDDDQTCDRFARIAVERAVDQFPNGLTYGIPADLGDSVRPGSRVIVPLGRGNKTTPGWVIDIDIDPEIEPRRIKPIASHEHAPPLPGQLIELAKWMSAYYIAPIGMTLAGMLPAAVRKGVGSVSRLVVSPNPEAPPQEKLAKSQAQLMAWVQERPASTFPIDERVLAAEVGLRTTGPVRRLVEKGFLIASRRTSIEADWARQAVNTFVPDALTEEQSSIIGDLIAKLDEGFSTHLLFGVTGSGKTEVYIRLIEGVVARGKVALVLVPEIALTPQTAGRLIGRFPNHRVAVLHSGLTSAQRHQQWAMVAADEADLILGARSAIFAPVSDDRLGVIIVDEEHDSSYKQDQVPRYHGRDVAIRRAQLAGIPIVLGSATPSLESWHNACEGAKSTLHRLTARAPGLRLPRVVIVDFIEEMKQYGDKRVHLIGPTLNNAIDDTLRSNGQALLLLNRRGYANYITCASSSCGWLMQCDDCDVTMVYHLNRRAKTSDGAPMRPTGYVQCHHCLAQQRLPEKCPDCGQRIMTFGLGTQRVEAEILRRWPELVEGDTLLRVDSDTMHRATDFYTALSRFGAGEVRVLVGTQMIAKGLDFPGVRLVGVINADTALNLPDFRASERTFQLVNQVAGRCGRGLDPGLAIVQTFNPEDPAIVNASSHDFPTFARGELEHRRVCGLPPFSRMARIIVRDTDQPRALARAVQLERALKQIEDPPIRIRPAAPCPIARIAGRHRMQIELLAPTAGVLQRFLTSARQRDLIHADATLAVDVDPVSML